MVNDERMGFKIPEAERRKKALGKRKNRRLIRMGYTPKNLAEAMETDKMRAILKDIVPEEEDPNGFYRGDPMGEPVDLEYQGGTHQLGFYLGFRKKYGDLIVFPTVTEIYNPLDENGGYVTLEFLMVPAIIDTMAGPVNVLPVKEGQLEFRVERSRKKYLKALVESRKNGSSNQANQAKSD